MINGKGQERNSFIPPIKFRRKKEASLIPQKERAATHPGLTPKMMISTITKTERVNIQGRGAVETDKDPKALSVRYSPWATKGL